MKKAALSLCVILNLFVCGLVLSKADSSIAEIEKVAKNAERIETQKTTQEVMLGTVLLENDDISHWQIMNPKKNNECNDEAHLYFVEKRLSSFHIRLGTPTGDWGEHRFYCYREDGSLALISYDYYTFCDGDIKIIARLYFDGKGKKLKETVKFTDIETNRTIKPKNDLYYPPEAYLTTRDALKKFEKDLKGVAPPWRNFN